MFHPSNHDWDPKKKTCREKFFEELTKVFGFQDALGTGIEKWDRCLQFKGKLEGKPTLYVEIIMVGSVYIVREQRAEEVKFSYFYWPEAVLEYLDLILCYYL